MTKDLPSPELLRKLLRYEPDTGNLFWRHRESGPNNWNARFAGSEALTVKNDHGYLYGTCLGVRVSAHRVAWAIATGSWPKDIMDHKDRNRANNSLSNLREATRAENQRNQTSAKGSSSKYLGVHMHKASGLWRSTIRVDGRQMSLGYFSCEGAAAKAYDKAAIKYYGEFASPNFKSQNGGNG